MLRLKSIFAALALVSASATVAAPVATAQAADVIVLNEAKLLRDSRAGKDIASKIENIEKQMLAELKPTGDALKTEGTSLQARLNGKSPQQIQADASLKAAYEGYMRKANDYGNRRQKAAQELSLTERKALIDFNAAVEPVLQEVFQARGAKIMVSRSSVIFANSTVDITNEVISKLDARTPSITVTRQRIPAQAAQ